MSSGVPPMDPRNRRRTRAGPRTSLSCPIGQVACQHDRRRWSPLPCLSDLRAGCAPDRVGSQLPRGVEHRAGATAVRLAAARCDDPRSWPVPRPDAGACGAAVAGRPARAVRQLSRRWAEVRLPKVGRLRFRLSRPLGGAVRNATVRQDGLGWHVCFGVATGVKPAPPNGLPGCGVDFGVACSAFVSDEPLPRLMAPSLTLGEQRRLLGLERRKARQVRWAKRHNGGRYSNRLRRTIAEIAKLRARQARRRQDFTHKLTTDLTKSHGWVAIEDLRVKRMTKSAKGTTAKPGRNVKQKAGLNRSILDNAPYERRRQLVYKAPRFGSELRLVPAPGTSQTCSACGTRDPESRQGCGRTFACTACGHQAHADLNAACNIQRLAAGQAAYSTRSHPTVARPLGSRTREPLGSAA